MQSQVLKLKIPREKIAYLKFILEGYSHLALLTVENPKEGLVSLYFFPSEKDLVLEILTDFFNQIKESF